MRPWNKADWLYTTSRMPHMIAGIEPHNMFRVDAPKEEAEQCLSDMINQKALSQGQTAS